jgi:DNA-binding XRE family transcriptional regulator
MARKRKPTTDAIEILDRLFYDGKPERRRQMAETQANDEIGRMIRQLRTEAGLTQAQLGKLIGTTASVICRLEDADYEGHSLAMLRRIAAALEKRVEIRFVPLRKSA